MKRLVSRALLKVAAESTRLAHRLSPPPPPPPPPLTEHERRIAPWREADGDRTLRVAYDLDEGSVVWDVGGYEGDWAAEIAARYRSRIEVFEPVPAYAARIQERFKRNPGVSVHQVGLGGRTRSDAIRLQADGSSIFANGGETIAIEIIDIVDKLGERGVSEIALLKLNIEGAEYELLERLVESGEIRRVRNLQVQFHDIIPDADARRAAIREALEHTHICVYCFPWVWEGWSRKEV
jgi:FkbM family methyltransferase